jgi:beta-glucosidase
MMKILFFAIITCICSVTALAQADKNAQAAKFVDSLVRIMTLEEKIGQMNQYNGFWDVTGPAPNNGNAKIKYEHLKKGWVGSMLNITGVEKVRKLQELVVKESRLGIPLIFGFDVIHGYKTMSPIPLAEAASWDINAISGSARMAATEATAVGINWVFAPMVDISRDPRWGRVMEGAGEDTYLGSRIAVARVEGFQGKNLSNTTSVAACAKHFAAYGFAEGGRDYNTVDVGTTTLYNTILPPFKAASNAGVATFMNSFNVLNGVPATANKFLQQDILKNQWKFKGFVVSDWGSGREMIDHGYAKDLEDAAKLAANAGSDMDMESLAYVTHLKKLVEDGKVSVDAVNDAVRRILTVKYELGLFQNPYKNCDLAREKADINTDKHNAIVLDLAKKSIVLLKNDKNKVTQKALLPLHKGQKKIAVIGALANDKTSPLGSWSLAADTGTAVSILEGLAKYGNNFTYTEGAKVHIETPEFIRPTKINETDKSGFAKAIAIAKKSDIIIMVLGENRFQSGEGRSRAKLGLPGVQQELLEAVYKVNKNIVLVLMNGRPLTIEWAAKHIPTIVESWHLGTQSGHAVAQVLYGDYNPSGKLPMTFPKSEAHLPVYYNPYNTGRPGPSDMVFWSHYNDEKHTPLFSFGHGLSYTSFEYSALKIEQKANTEVQVSVTVTNTGNYDGEEVVQLYIRDKVASIVRPVKELKGFSKKMIKKGESITITFSLTKEELSFYDANGNFIVEPGEFDVMVGSSSEKGLNGSFYLQSNFAMENTLQK